MSCRVITVSSRTPDRVKESYYRPDWFLSSLKRLGVEPTVLGMGETWSGLMTKPFHFRAWISNGIIGGSVLPDEHIILTDCWDVIFTKHPDWIVATAKEHYGNAVVFNGEKGCWPREDLRDKFPETMTPWRYLNSGVIVGPAQKILDILNWMDLEKIGVDRVEGGKKIEPNDQGEFQRAFAEQPVPMVVDGMCQVAQTFSACEPGEFEITKDGVRNKETMTWPGIIHGNGNAKPMLAALAKALGIA